MSVVDLTTGEVLGVSLAENEAVIERDLKAFIRVGRALAAIRDGRQYHDNGYSDFDTYCQERWGFSRRRAGEFIEAYEVASAVGEISPTAEPARESHAAALAPLRGDPEAMAEVMAEVTAEGKVTAEKITEKVTERLTANMHPGEADADTDELGDEATPADIAEGMAEAIESRDPAPITKPDLGGGVSHPARYSKNLLPIFADLLDGYDMVLDPFAGTGRIHELPNRTIGVELEREYAEIAIHSGLDVAIIDMTDWSDGRSSPEPSDGLTLIGSALNLLCFADDAFDAVCTSPTYGNRLADSHNASDPERRRSYTHDLGRKLSDDNSGAMQWGDEYREFHETAWAEAVRVLRPGGRFVLNIKDHIRGGVQQPVTAWHVAALVDLGMRYNAELSHGAPTGHLQQGSNSEARAGQELVLVFDKGVD